MDNCLAYNMSRYDFSKETWSTIFSYESGLSSQKVFKKVNFKKGELDSYISWVKKIISSSEFIKIVTNGIDLFNSNNYYSKEKALKEKQLNNNFYIKHKLEKVMKRNKYFIEKISRYGLRFSFEDVREFLIILKYAEENNCIVDFLSIPDIWYIIRNIRSNWDFITNKKIDQNVDYNLYI